MKLFNKIRSLGRKSKVALVVLALGVGVAVPVVNAEFYPDRPTYDYNKFDPNNNNCLDPNNPATQNGRCGSMNGPVFNSFVNVPGVGDERAFFDGRRSDQPNTSNVDDIQNVTDGPREVTLRMYVHNNANAATNASGVGIARNTKARILLPTATEQVMRARAYVTADNAAMVEDTVDMLGRDKFSVAYVPGSAKLIRGSQQAAISDSIVTTGAPIGDQAMDGNLPGCFEYFAVIEIRVKVNVKPELQLTKHVKVKGGEAWLKETTTKPGSEVQWMLGTKNISNGNMANVVVRDIMPPHLRLVPGSVRLISGTNDHKLPDAPLFTTGGFNVGNYVPGSTQYVIFNTITLDDFKTCDVRVRNLAYAHSDQTPEISDSAVLVIRKDGCKPSPNYSCDLLTMTKIDNKTARFDTKASATNGATIVLYQYDFGDGTPVLSTDKATVTHTYAKEGNYAARVRVQVNVNGEMKFAESDKCAAAVPVSVTPAGPTTLPSTGPGEVIGIFAAVSAAGAIAHRWILGRRFSH